MRERDPAMTSKKSIRRLQRAVALATSRNDIVLAVLIVAIVFMMILPLPTTLVDVLIGANMTLSAVLLMVAMYLPSPWRFPRSLRSCWSPRCSGWASPSRPRG